MNMTETLLNILKNKNASATINGSSITVFDGQDYFNVPDIKAIDFNTLRELRLKKKFSLTQPKGITPLKSGYIPTIIDDKSEANYKAERETQAKAKAKEHAARIRQAGYEKYGYTDDSYTTPTKKRSKVPFAATLQGRPINSLVNDFAVKFLSKGQAHSQTRLKREWKAFARKQQIPTREGFDKDIFKDVQKVIAQTKGLGLENGKGGIVKQTHNAEYDFEQNMMVVDGDAYLFTNRNLGEKQIATIASKLKTTFPKAGTKVTIVTPQGVKKAFVHADETISQGTSYLQNNYSPYHTGKAFVRDNAQDQFTESVRSKEIAYHQSQYALRDEAYSQLRHLATVTALSYNGDLGSLTVQDLKSYSQVHSKDYKALQGYKGFDGLNIDKALKEKDFEKLYSISHERKTDIAHDLIQSDFEKLLRNSGNHGVEQQAVATDLERLNKSGYLGEDFKITESGVKAISDMNQHLGSTVNKGRLATVLNKMVLTQPAQAASWILDNANNERFISRYNLASWQADNPMLNLEGNLHSNLGKHLALELVQRAKTGNMPTVNPETLQLWGTMLSGQGLRTVSGTFKRGIKNYARELISNKTLNRYDKDVKLSKAKTVLEGFFGGARGVESLRENIRAFHLGKTDDELRSLRISGEAFANGESFSDLEENKAALERFNELRNEQSGQMKERGKDGSYKGDLLDLDLDTLKRRALQETNISSVNIQSLGRKGLLQEVRDFNARIKDETAGPYDIQEMRLLANQLGIDEYISNTGKKLTDINDPRQISKFLTDYMAKADQDDLHRLDTSRSKVYMPLSKGLAKQMYAKDKKGYKEGFSSYDPKVVRYMEDNKADWGLLMDNVHGDKNMSLMIGGEAATIRGDILGHIQGYDVFDKYREKLEPMFKGSHIATNIDEIALKSIKESLVHKPNTNEWRIGSVPNVESALEMLVNGYGSKPFVASKIAQPFGKGAFKANATLNNKGRVTLTNRKASLSYLKKHDAFGDFEATGKKYLPSKLKLKIDRNILKANLRNSILSQDIFQDTGIQAKDRDGLLAKLYKSVDLAYDTVGRKIHSGDYQAALANITGLDTLNKDAKSAITTKKALRLFNALQADPEGNFNKAQKHSAHREYSTRALAYSEASGFRGYELGDEIAKTRRYSEGLHGDNILSSRLGLTNYKSPESLDKKIVAFGSKLAQLQDPDDQALKSGLVRTANIFKGIIIDPKRELLGAPSKAKPKPHIGMEGILDYNHKFRGWKRPVSFKKLPTTQKQKYTSVYDPDQPYPTYRKVHDGFSELDLSGRMLGYTSNFTMLNKGGKIPGKGTKDEVPALLTKGEVVVDRETSENLGINSQADYHRFKTAARAGKISHFETGGKVGVEAFKIDFSDLTTDSSLAAVSNKLHLLTKNLNLGNQKAFEGLMSNLEASLDLTDSNTANSFKRLTESYTSKAINGAAVMPESTKAYEAELRANRHTNVKDIDVESGPSDKSYTKSTDYFEGGTDKIDINAKNLMMDLNSDKITVEGLAKMGPDSRVALEGVLTHPDVDKVQAKIAKKKLKNLDLATALGLDAKDTQLLSNINNVQHPATSADISKGLKTQIANLDSDRVQAALSLYGDQGQRTAFRGLGKEAFSGQTSSGKIDFAKKLSSEADVLKEVLGIDFKDIKTVQDIKNRLGKVNLDKVKVKGGFSTNRLRHQEDALGTLASALGTDDFEGYGAERASVRGIKGQVAASERLRTGSASRYREFAALTMQNAAFGMSYALIGGVQQLAGSTVGFVTQFDDAMQNLQAITGETADGLDTMSQAVKRVSVETKFSALEIAEAGTILGQAGFSATDIDKSLSGVVQLATATGSGLEESTQVLTSALTIWDNSIADSTKYANQFTAAVNESKLDINALALTLQYAGNIAAEADIPIEDVTTMTSLLKDAGIKRGSTLGTGQRLLYSDIANPSKKFAKSLETVGISLASFNEAFADKGLYGALELMKESGYGLAQASKGMELREKSIYTAAINQLDQFEGFRDSITNTDASYIANKTQMEGLGNSMKNMVNSWQINMNESFTGSKDSFRTIMKGLTIDIAEKDPSRALTTKGMDMQSRNAEAPAEFSIVQGAVGLGAATYLSKDILAKSLNGAISSPKVKGALFDALVLGSKGLSKLGGTSGLLGMAGIAASGYTRANESEGSRTADFVNDVVGFAALAVGERMSKGMTGIKKFGTMGAVAASLMIADNAVLKPARESDNDDVRGGTYAGIGAMAGLGVVQALGMTNPWTILPTIAATTGAGYFFGSSSLTKKEAPKKDAVATMSALANDLKALSSEIGVLNKGATSISSLSNFAMRPSTDADDLERTAKFTLATQAASQMNDKLKILESSLSSYSTNGFTGFNFEPERKGKNSFMANEYTADGVNIVLGSNPFKGDAVDAIAHSMRTAEEAAYKAFNAKGGAGEGLMANIDPKNMGDFKEKLAKQRNVKDMNAVVSAEATKPVMDILKTRPGFAIRNKKQIEAYFKAVDETMINVMTDKSKDFNKDYHAYGTKITRRNAQIEATMSRGSSRATTLAEVEDITKAQLSEFLATNKGKFTDTDQAKAAFDKTVQGQTNRSAYTRVLKETSGVDSLFTKLSLGKINLDNLDTVGIDLIRNLDLAVAKTVSKAMIDAGPALTQNALSLSSGMQETLDSMSKSIKQQASKLGDITNISTKDLISSGTTLVTNGKAKQAYDDYLNFKPEGTKKEQRAQLLDQEKRIKTDSQGLVSLGNLDDLVAGMVEINKIVVDKYKENKTLSNSLTNTIFDITSLSEPRAQVDIGIYKAVENLQASAKKAGFKDLAASKELRTNRLSRDELLAMDPKDVTAFFSDKRVRQLDTAKAKSLESLEVNTLNAKELLDFSSGISIREAGISSKQAGARLERSNDFQIEQSGIKYQRALRDINVKTGWARDKAQLNYTRQIQKIQLNYQRNTDKAQLNYTRGLEDISLKRDRAYRDLAISEGRSLRDLAVKETRGRRDLDIQSTKALRDLDKGMARQEEDLATKIVRAYRDLDTKASRGQRDLGLSSTRGYEDLGLQAARRLEDATLGFDRGTKKLSLRGSRGYEDLNTAETRGNEDLDRKIIRAKEDLKLQSAQGLEDLSLKGVRGREDIDRKAARSRQALSLRGDRGEADLTTRGLRGRKDIQLNYSRNLDNLDISRTRGLEDISLNFQRSLENLNTNLFRSRADASRGLNRGREDLGKKTSRALEDSLTKFNDNIASIGRSYQDTLDSLSRSRSDTREAFNRSLNRPQTVSLTPESLLAIANNLGDVSLALDAHKAALENNTTAVKQNSAIQKTSEDLAKEAYKDAYKKVGGEVYSADGSLNSAFSDAYDLYMNKNSDKLIDTVLNNALDSAFAGGGFNIGSALQDASYIAGAVSTPEPGVTTQAVVAGSGYSDTELTQALYGIKAGEVRVSSTAGIILEAQGGMEGALFDLETAMIQIGIRIREASISYQTNLREASIAYQNNLRDITEANSRGLTDLQEQFSRQLEDISLNNSRQLQDATLAYQRALEDLEQTLTRREDDLALRRVQELEDLRTALSRAGVDLSLALSRAGEDLTISIKQAGEDLNISLARSGEDIARSIERATIDLDTSITRWQEDLSTSMLRAGEDLSLSLVRAGEDLNISLSETMANIAISNTRAGEDLETKLTRAGEDLVQRIADAREDLVIQQQDALTDMALGFTRSMDDLNVRLADAGVALSLSLSDAGIDLRTKIVDAGQDIRKNFADATADLDTQLTRALTDAALAFSQNLTDARLALSQSMEDISIQAAQQRTLATQSFKDNLDDIKARYAFDKNELSIATKENIDKINRGIADAFDKIDLTNTQAKAKIEKQFQDQALALYEMLADWSEQTKEDFKLALSAKQWDLRDVFNNLETKVKEALSKFDIDATAIFRTVAAGFKQALEGDALKQVQDLTSIAVSDTFKGAFQNLNKPVAETVKEVGKLLEDIYNAETAKKITTMSGLAKSNAKDLNINLKALKTSVAGTEAVSTSIKDASKILSDANTSFGGAATGLSEMSTTLSNLNLATGMQAVADGMAFVPSISASLQGSGATLKTSATQLSSASSSLLTTSGTVGNSAGTAISNMADASYFFGASFTPLAQSVVNGATAATGYIVGAISSINSALANVSPTRASVGGRVGSGYGGGDTESYMLEPGEYVIKKEMVRHFGDSYFEDLNNGISRNNVQPMAVTMGLPSQNSNGININMNIGVDASLSTIESNMDRIADGVKRIFEEYN